MNKRYILLAVAASVLCACDPVEEDATFDPIETNSEAVSAAFSFTQADKAGNPASDGNYFTYTTSPAQIVKVYNYKADGSVNLLACGASGSFTIAPGRGSDPNQKFYVAVYNSDGTEIVAEKTANVFVKADLTTTEKLFCSDSGRKTYKWNTAAPNGYVWGNCGYGAAATGKEFATTGTGQWWGVNADSIWAGQLEHSVKGQLTGEESFDAYMVFTEDGIIEKYDGKGAKLGESTYEVVEQTENTDWAKYHLKTGEDAILWPFEINGGGKYVTEYEVVYLTPSLMTLVYPDGGDFSSLGGWGEASFWQFKADDVEGVLNNLDGSEKKWAWNAEAPNGQVWGNIGYKGCSGTDLYSAGGCVWWGITDEETFGTEDQLVHAVGGKLQGDESFNAYFTLSADGTLKKYDGEGKLINTTTWSLDTDRTSADWAVGHLVTGENSVLWPYEINGGGKYVTDFEIVYLDDTHMTLTYPDGGDFDNYGSWSEASFWQFKVKE